LAGAHEHDSREREGDEIDQQGPLRGQM
jgi:hypothetical protein